MSISPLNSDLKAIILAGNNDFGRCPLTSHLPTALWPVVDKPVLENLIQNLWSQGIQQIRVCCNGNVTQLKNAISNDCCLKADFLSETLPLGTAGCLRDAAREWQGPILMISATTVLPPDVGQLMREHQAEESELTVMFNSTDQTNQMSWDIADIYICEPKIINYIPKQGYCDIKETLIPMLIRVGKTVHAVKLSKPIGKFRNRHQYLVAMKQFLADREDRNIPLLGIEDKLTQMEGQWISETAKIASNVRIYGPVMIMNNASIHKDSVLFGPVTIGPNVSIGNSTLVENSVLWRGVTIGNHCCLSDCVVDYNATVPDGSTIQNEPVLDGRNRIIKRCAQKAIDIISEKKKQLKRRFSIHRKEISRLYLRTIFVLFLIAVFLWSYWPEINQLWKIWNRSDEYSSGLLVPFLAAYVLWVKRDKISSIKHKPLFCGLLLLVAAQLIRYFGLFFMYGSAERISLVVSIASIILIFFGWQMFCQTLPITLFLFLMLPLPRSIHNAVMLPLQNIATVSSVFILEILGFEAVQHGNIININEKAIAVAEACNGLRMITAFFVIVGLVVLVIQGKWWEKAIVLVSGLPIALICNVIRLTIIAILFARFSGNNFEAILHDFGGYAMMPLGIACVLLELWFLKKITTQPHETSDGMIVNKCFSQTN